MKMLTIPETVLPDDWLAKIENYDIDNSDLPESLKPLSQKIKTNILNNKEDAVVSYFNIPFIRHVCLGVKWKLDKYEKIPSKLIKEVFDELGSQKGTQYDVKLYSLFSELFAYVYLELQGYRYKEFERSTGSCDLTLEKDGVAYNCEVKLKKSEDNHSRGIKYYIMGKAWLLKYEKLRKLNMVYYKIINIPDRYDDIKKMYKEIEIFCKNPTELYEGEYIHLSSTEIRHSPQDYLITQHTESSTQDLIKNILTGANRHITKLIEKSAKYDNFIGYLSLELPFHQEFEKSDLENAFRLLNLNFKLYVEVNSIGIESPYVLEID